jgi:hypothetical protein
MLGRAAQDAEAMTGVSPSRSVGAHRFQAHSFVVDTSRPPTVDR